MGYYFETFDDCIDLHIDDGFDLHWSFPRNSIRPDIIDLILTEHRCGGCKTMPTDGFRSEKSAWCKFSRAVACLQEEFERIEDINPKLNNYHTKTLELIEAIKQDAPDKMYEILKVLTEELAEEYNYNFPAVGPDVYECWGSDC